MNIKTFKEALPYLFQANVATLVHGHHGIGKSEAVKQFCQENDYEFIDLRLGTQDVGDLLGLADFERDEKGNLVATKFYQPEWFPTDPNSSGIIFMDEINRARRDVLQAVFQLVLDKKLHTYELPKNWYVIGAMNPNTEDYIVTDLSDKAFLDRFCHIKLSPAKQEFFTHAKNIGVSKEILSFLQEQPKMLQDELEEVQLEVKPSRRSWIAADKIFKQNPPTHILNDLVKGLVGTQAGTSFIKSLNDSEKPITAKEVVNNFNNSKKDVKKRIKKYSSVKDNKQTLIKFTNDELREFCEGRKKELNDSETKNLQDYLKTIPKDLSFDLCRELFMIPSSRHVVNNDDELLKLLADTRNVKVKGLND